MNKKQAENCLTLVDLMDEMKDSHWDFRLVPYCAIGYARQNIELFGVTQISPYSGDVERIFGNEGEIILMGRNLSDRSLDKVTNVGIRRKLLKAVDTAGWEEA